MSQDESSEDLELVKRILDLTRFLEENSKQISELRGAIDELEHRFENTDISLGQRDEEIKQKFKTLDEKHEDTTSIIAKIQEDISDVNKTIEGSNSEIHSTQNELEGEIHKVQGELDVGLSNLKSIQEDLRNSLTAETTEVRELISKEVTEIRELISKDSKEIREIFSIEKNDSREIFENVNIKISDFVNTSQTQFDALKKSMEILGVGLEQLGRLGDSHAGSLDEHKSSLLKLKENMQEIISSTKKDQETHFENFSRIIESYNESIRTELGLTAQALKESDTKILDEISANFMSKKVGERLEKMISDLTEELKTEAKQTREELVKGLQETVKDYEKIMDEQNTRIKNHQRELERFQDEIQAIIDRKVNEKYEIVYSLLAKVISSTEELALLLKTAEVHVPEAARSLKNISSSEAEKET